MPMVQADLLVDLQHFLLDRVKVAQLLLILLLTKALQLLLSLALLLCLSQFPV